MDIQLISVVCFIMEFTLRTQSLFLLAVVFLQLYQAEVGESMHIVSRCVCPETKKFILVAWADFSITEKGPHCGVDEIIVTLQKNNQEVCLSPDGRQGRNLLRCWEEKNKEESKKASCLPRRWSR